MSDRSPPGQIAHADTLRLGRVAAARSSGVGEVSWRMARLHSIAPRQLVMVFASLSAVSAGIAALFWLSGAPLVMPFALVELLALGAAIVVHARHAGDGENIRLTERSLCVEHCCGTRSLRVDFQPAWVRVEPVHAEGSLVELRGEGRRVAVGRYVRAELRVQLARELRWALRQRRLPAGTS